MIIKLIRKPPWLKVWSAITGVALVVALVFTFLPYETSIDDGILSIGLRQASANPGWVSGYDYRKSHNLTGATGAGYNYTVSITIHSGNGADSGDDVYLSGHCTDFPNDIAFTDNDATTELDTWCEDLTADPAVFWIEVSDSLESGTVPIYIYYGKSGQTSAFNSYKVSDPYAWARKTIVKGGEQIIDMDSGETYAASEEGIRAWQKDVSAFSIALTKIRDSYESTGFLDLARKYKAVEDLPDRFVFSVDRLRKALVNVRGQTRKDAERSYDELMALAQQGQLARYGAGNKSIEFAKPVIVEGHSEN